MANIFVTASFAALFLVLLPMIAFGDLGNSTDVCNQVTCGKGTCKLKPDYIPHSYTCDCDSGWRRTRLPDTEEQYLQFLPCIIPNCSINYSCMPAPPPLPPIPTNPYNVSQFDPCYWAYCGEGTCQKSSDDIHSCQCQPGAYNLFNISHFPCYSDCAVGSDCSKLGIKVSKASLTTGSGPTASLGSSLGASANNGMRSWKLNWIILAIMSLAVISWR